MNIFYFSKIPNLSKIINNIDKGDLCFLQNTNELLVFIHDSDPVNNKLIIKTRYTQRISLNIRSNNPIVFSYNGETKREGNIMFLLTLLNVIKEATIIQIIKQAISILNYKEDRINANCLLNIYKLPYISKEILVTNLDTKEEINHSFNIESKVSEDKAIKTKKGSISYKQNTTVSPDNYYFYDYLNQILRDQWINLHNKNVAIRNIMQYMRKDHKIFFRQAFRTFTQHHPNLNIYSIKELSASNSPESFKRVKELNFIYEALESNGYNQISNDEWTNQNNFIVNISLSKKGK